MESTKNSLLLQFHFDVTRVRSNFRASRSAHVEE